MHSKENVLQCYKQEFYSKGEIITKKRIENFDFIRSICAYIIIIYHFAGSCNTTPKFAEFPFFYNYANGIWGENTIVNIFFMISGASLFYNHPNIERKDLKKYYFNRFKGIFPMFYIVWLFSYYQNVTTYQRFNFNGPVSTMLLSLFGMDGYLSYRFPENYYFIGEWFLGALIFLYILYPILTWCMQHLRLLTTLLLGIGTLSMIWLQPLFLIQKERNLIVCLFAFWFGMLFVEYRNKLIHPVVLLPATCIAGILLFIKIPLDPFYCAQIISVCLFLLFYKAGDYIMRPEPLRRFIQHTSKLSYAIFLLQHVVIVKVLYSFITYKLTLPHEMLILGLVFVFIYLFASIITLLTNTLFEKKFFQKIQSFFYR